LTHLRQANQFPLPFYFLPSTDNYTSVDCVVCTAHEIIFIQSTVGNKRDVAPSGVQNILENLPIKFAKQRTRCFVFVTNSDTQADRLRKLKLKDLSQLSMAMFSCVFHIGDARSEGEVNVIKGIADRASSIDVSNGSQIATIHPEIDGQEEHIGKGAEDNVEDGRKTVPCRSPRLGDRNGKDVIRLLS
jgi:hypothetical protein